jgi:hypothetical protein
VPKSSNVNICEWESGVYWGKDKARYNIGERYDGTCTEEVHEEKGFGWAIIIRKDKKYGYHMLRTLDAKMSPINHR